MYFMLKKTAFSFEFHTKVWIMDLVYESDAKNTEHQ